MSSLFSNCFPSDTLLRLWDLIFLEFSSPDGGGRTKGLGYMISACLYLISINQQQILMANTPEELEIAIDNSRSVVFNTEEIIEEIFNINTKNFVAGNWFSRRLANISKVFGDAASYLDNARISLEEDYDLIFEKTMRENKVVWDMLYPDEESKEVLNYNTWNDDSQECIMTKFKNIFGQRPSKWYKEDNSKKAKEGNLQFSTIYIFVYNWFDVQNIGKPSIDFACEYNGKQSICPIDKYDKMTVLEHCFRLSYTNSKNEVVFKVNEGKKIFGKFSIDLNNYKPDRVYKFWIDIISETDNDNDYEFQIGLLCESSNRENSEDVDQVFKHSLKRKTPDRIDLLNEDHETDFIDRVKDSLLAQIEFEKSILSEYYDSHEIMIMLNQKYNYIVSKQLMDAKNIELDDLRYFNEQVFFSRWDGDMKRIYDEFTLTTKMALANKSDDTANILDRAAVMLLTRTLARRNNKLFGMENQDQDSSFNIRNYIVTLILMSSLTVGQKLDMLYEVFDWEDGEGDGLDSQSIKLMINTILNRNLQFISSNQVNNMVELAFDGYSTCISS